MDNTEFESGVENSEKKVLFKRQNAKRRWKDEECRTGGYSRSKFRTVGLKIAIDQMNAIEEA